MFKSGIGMLRSAAPWMLVAASTLLWIPALASESAESDDEGGIVEYVEVDATELPKSNTIATKLPVPIEITPAHVGVVGRTLLDEQDADVLGDALRNVSGLNVVNFSGVFDYFLIRGFDSVSSSAILTDGVQEPESSFHQSYNIEGVEVLKGPSGFLYGPNPLGGVVNIVRKQPLGSDFGRVRLSAGSWDTFDGALDWNVANEDGSLAFRLNGIYQESDGYRDGQEWSQAAINPSLRWRPSDRSSLTFNLEVVDADYVGDSGIPLLGGELPPVSRTTSYQSPFDTSEQDIVRFQVDFEHRLRDGLTLRNKTYYRELEWLSDGTLFSGVFPVAPGAFLVDRLLLSLDDEQTFTGNQFEVVWSTSTGSVRHEILAGVETAIRADEYTLRGSCAPLGSLAFTGQPCPAGTALAPIDLLSPVEMSTRPFLAPFDRIDPGTPGAGDAEATIVAPYVVDTISFGERVNVLLGLRYDDIDFEDDVSGFSRDDSDLSTMLGASFTPGGGFTVYANAASSFSPATARVIGARDPEESDQIEVGIKQNMLDGRARLALAAYTIDRENIAILDDNGFTLQAGDQTSDGFELEFAVEPVEGLRWFLAYAYTDAELTRFSERGFDFSTFPPTPTVLRRDGNTPAFVPEHLASTWLSCDLPGGFGIGGGVRYWDDQFIAEDNATEIDGATLLDLAGWYRFDDWKLQVNLRNVTDEDYETRGFGSQSVTPGNPFSVGVAVEFAF